MNKELLFSVTIKDCDISTFRSGGPGGQHQNKTESGVRIAHRASGAVGISREMRSQHKNKQLAFSRMASDTKFKKWHKIECAKKMGNIKDVENKVNQMMEPKNIKIEVMNVKTAIVGAIIFVALTILGVVLF